MDHRSPESQPEKVAGMVFPTTDLFLCALTWSPSPTGQQGGGVDSVCDYCQHKLDRFFVFMIFGRSPLFWKPEHLHSFEQGLDLDLVRSSALVEDNVEHSVQDGHMQISQFAS